MVLMVLAQALWLGLLATGMTPCISKGNLIQVYAGRDINGVGELALCVFTVGAARRPTRI